MTIILTVTTPHAAVARISQATHFLPANTSVQAKTLRSENPIRSASHWNQSPLSKALYHDRNPLFAKKEDTV